MKELAGIVGYSILLLFVVTIHILPIAMLIYLMYLDVAARVAIGMFGLFYLSGVLISWSESNSYET